MKGDKTMSDMNVLYSGLKKLTGVMGYAGQVIFNPTSKIQATDVQNAVVEVQSHLDESIRHTPLLSDPIAPSPTVPRDADSLGGVPAETIIESVTELETSSLYQLSDKIDFVVCGKIAMLVIRDADLTDKMTFELPPNVSTKVSTSPTAQHLAYCRNNTTPIIVSFRITNGEIFIQLRDYRFTTVESASQVRCTLMNILI